MRETDPFALPRPEHGHERPSIEQMVRDLQGYEAGLSALNDFHSAARLQFLAAPEFVRHLPDFFEQFYGYPDPRRIVYEQGIEARGRGEPEPQTPESKAVDVFYYEKGCREADEDQPSPSFEELYGYPDPRQVGPGESGGPSGAR